MNTYILLILATFSISYGMEQADIDGEPSSKKINGEEIIATPPATPPGKVNTIDTLATHAANVLMELGNHPQEKTTKAKRSSTPEQRKHHSKQQRLFRQKYKKHTKCLTNLILPHMLSSLPPESQKTYIQLLQKLSIPHFHVKTLAIQNNPSISDYGAAL